MSVYTRIYIYTYIIIFKYKKYGIRIFHGGNSSINHNKKAIGFMTSLEPYRF